MRKTRDISSHHAKESAFSDVYAMETRVRKLFRPPRDFASRTLARRRTRFVDSRLPFSRTSRVLKNLHKVKNADVVRVTNPGLGRGTWVNRVYNIYQRVLTRKHEFKVKTPDIS